MKFVRMLSLVILGLGGLIPFATISLAQTPPKPATAAPPLAPLPGDLQVTHDVEIGKGGDTVLHAEIVEPKDSKKALGRAIIYVHGGGWKGGTNKVDVVRTYFLAQAGYLVASIEYRLSTTAPWPAQLEDCKLGVRWLRANADKYHIDPAHIGLYGHSAGGHLVACLGTMDDPKYEGAGGYAGVSSKVQAIVDTSGPVDFRAGNFYDGSTYTKAKGAYSDDLLLTLFGTPFAKNPALWAEGSPVTHVQAGDPPFFIASGEIDPIVSPVQGKTLADALEKAGVPVEFVFVKNANHGLGGLPGGPASDPSPGELRKRMLAFYAKYLL
jgi:acetyl esterase/lipase